MMTVSGLMACGDTDSGSFVVRDSLGITIAENRGQAWGPEETWTIAPEPLVRVGSVEGRTHYQLHDVQGVVRLVDGTLVVANAGTHEIRFFDEAGRHIRSVGREGDGPGEYRLISALGVSSRDSVWVYDYGLRRFTILTRHGEFVRLVSLGPTLSAPNAIGRLADGSFVIKEQWSSSLHDEWQPGLSRGLAAVTRLMGEGSTSDTVAMLLGREVFLSDEDGRAVMSAPLFARASSAAVSRDAIYLGDQETFEVLRYSADGELRGITRVLDVDLSITQADIDAEIQRQLARVPKSRQTPLRQQLESMALPPTRPAYGRLRADPYGHLWAAEPSRYPFPAGEWTVFNPDGLLLGVVQMPRRFRLQQVGTDWVLGTWRDELDVEYVTLHQLSKPR
jgi:hypothetical protein